jgi:hypothetical protein
LEVAFSALAAFAMAPVGRSQDWFDHHTFLGWNVVDGATRIAGLTSIIYLIHRSDEIDSVFN